LLLGNFFLGLLLLLLACCGTNENTQDRSEPPSTQQYVWYADHRDLPFCDTKLVIEHGALRLTIVTTHICEYHSTRLSVERLGWLCTIILFIKIIQSVGGYGVQILVINSLKTYTFNLGKSNRICEIKHSCDIKTCQPSMRRKIWTAADKA